MLSARALRTGALAAAAAPFVQAAGSLVVQLLAARELGAAGFARWALLLSLLVFLAALASGLVGDSLTVLDRHRPAVRSGLLGWALLLGVLGGGLLAAGAVLAGLLAPPAGAALLAAAALFCWQELLRRLLMATERFASVLVVDAVTAGVTLGGALWLAGSWSPTGGLDVAGLLAATAAGQLIGLLVGLAQLPRDERSRPRGARPDWGTVAAFGGWRALQVSVRPAGLAALRSLTIAAVGAAAVGPIEAARLFAAPATLLAGGAGSFLLVRAVRLRSHSVPPAGHGEGERRRCDRAALLLAGVTGALSLAAVGAAELAGPLVTAGRYPLPISAVVGWSAHAVALAGSIPYASSAAVRGRHVTVAVIRLGEALLAAAGAALLLLVGGGAGLLPWALAAAAPATVLPLRWLVPDRAAGPVATSVRRAPAAAVAPRPR